MTSEPGVIFADVQHRRKAEIARVGPGLISLTLSNASQDLDWSKGNPFNGSFHQSASVTLNDSPGWFACFDDSGNLQFGVPGVVIHEATRFKQSDGSSGDNIRILADSEAAAVCERIAKERGRSEAQFKG